MRNTLCFSPTLPSDQRKAAVLWYAWSISLSVKVRGTRKFTYFSRRVVAAAQTLSRSRSFRAFSSRSSSEAVLFVFIQTRGQAAERAALDSTSTDACKVSFPASSLHPSISTHRQSMVLCQPSVNDVIRFHMIISRGLVLFLEG